MSCWWSPPCGLTEPGSWRTLSPRPPGGLAAVFSGEGNSHVYALVQADGGDITPLVKRLNAALSGRGGGRNGFAQGSVQADGSAIRAFFHKEGME